MDFHRRFDFTAFSSALSGLIYVPATTAVEVDCGSSALGITGGRARSELRDRTFADAVRVASATTFAEGVFDDERLARAVVSHKARQEELTATTTVRAELTGLSIGNNEGPFLTARRIRAGLISRSPGASGEPRIAPERGTGFTDVKIDDYGLAISLNLRLFQAADTHAKLLTVADNPRLLQSARCNLALGTRPEGQPVPKRPRLLSSDGTIYTSIVREIRWVGKPFPGATIEDHTVVVPDFGRIFFGELRISRVQRRLTMVRCDLGSPLRGYVGGGDVGSNGSWYP